MKELLISVEFWVAMFLAVVLKLGSSPKISSRSAAIASATAVASALIFTQPIVDMLELSSETYTYAVAALVALSAEHVARQILTLSLSDLVAIWRGKK